ncbi:leucine-rich repeat domain-containing protein [Candidatus Bipolaricaulota bacterium]|nr:leucine-rich repeat domain-containing protein [Candidatus Bipolaricaulota bacterium]
MRRLPDRFAPGTAGCIARLVTAVTVAAVMSAGFVAGAETWLLAIGVSDYLDPTITGLSYASLDAAAIAEQLTLSPDITSERVIILLDQQATRSAIESAFDWLAERTTTADTVLIYLAGHGASTVDCDGDEADGDGVDEAYLPYDAVFGDPDSYIIDDDLGRWVETLPTASVAMFFDACYSGGQSRDPDGCRFERVPSQDSTARDILTAGLPEQTRAVLAACQPWEQSYESRSLGHGVFTHFLLQGLSERETDANGDGAVSMQELAACVISSIEQWTAARPETQHPVLESNRDAASLLIAGVSQAERAVLVAYYPLDGDAQDTVGGRDGRLMRAETAEGVIDGAMGFDHAALHNTFIRTIDSYQPGERSFSISVWFRLEKPDAGRSQYILSTHGRENWYGPTYELYVGDDGSIAFRTNDADENRRQELRTTTWGWYDGRWHHVVVVRRADGMIELWLDGALEASQIFPIQDLRNGGNPLTIGATAYNGWSAGKSFRGEIDDLRIYEGALTTNEVRELFSQVVPDTPSSISDPAFQTALSSALGLPAEAISRYDLLALRTLDLGGLEIESLQGIELCCNLREIDVSGLELEDLLMLESCPAIIELDASDNRLTSMAGLESLSAIETLDISGNQIEDITPLGSLSALAYCDLSGNRIRDLSPLGTCPTLKTLELRGNPITSLDVFSVLPKIWFLDLGDCNLQDISGLVTAYNLRVLLLDENHLTDLSPIAELFAVEELDLSGNRISDISPLAELLWLGDSSHFIEDARDTVLDLAGNLIRDISPLAANPGLDAGDVIDLRDNPLDEDAERVIEDLADRGVIVRTDSPE